MIERLRRRWLLGQTRQVEVDGHPLTIPPGVLDPVLFRSGAWFAQRHAASLSHPGLRVLDMGCGSGVVGVLARAAGARVIATDIDPRACEAARTNGLPDVRQGDLFEPVRDEAAFDRICFNPPYLPGKSQDRPFGTALYGGEDFEVIRRFSAALDDFLAPDGEASRMAV